MKPNTTQPDSQAGGIEKSQGMTLQQWMVLAVSFSVVWGLVSILHGSVSVTATTGVLRILGHIFVPLSCISLALLMSFAFEEKVGRFPAAMHKIFAYSGCLTIFIWFVGGLVAWLIGM